MIPIELATPPPSIEKVLNDIKCVKTVKIAGDFFERELAISFNFVLDTESDSCFPLNSRGFSFQRKEMLRTQYVHRSGIAFIQILPNGQGFLWVNNRLHLASTSASSKLGHSTPGVSLTPSLVNPNLQQATLHPDNLRERFTSFCNDRDLLSQFYATVQEQLEGRIQKDMLNLQNPDKVMIIDSL